MGERSLQCSGAFLFISFEERLTFAMHNCSCGVCSCRDADQIPAYEADFRRSVNNLVAEKYEGDVYAYIKSLMDQIDILESNLENATIDFLAEAAA